MITEVVLILSGSRLQLESMGSSQVEAQAQEQEQVEWAIWPIWRT